MHLIARWRVPRFALPPALPPHNSTQPFQQSLGPLFEILDGRLLAFLSAFLLIHIPDDLLILLFLVILRHGNLLMVRDVVQQHIFLPKDCPCHPPIAIAMRSLIDRMRCRLYHVGEAVCALHGNEIDNYVCSLDDRGAFPTMSSRPLTRHYLVLLVGVIAISTSAILVKLSSAPAPIIAMYRMAFSAFISLVMLGMVRVRGVHFHSIRPREWLLCIVSGIFLALHFWLWFASLQLTSVVSSTVIVTTQPLFAALFAFVLFRERVRGWSIVGLAMVIVGGFCIGLGDSSGGSGSLTGSNAFLGDILAAAGAICIALCLLIGQHVRHSMEAIVYTTIIYSVSAVCLASYCGLANYNMVHYSGMDWLWFAALAVVPTLLGHSLFNWLLRWFNATAISMSILFEPIGTAILAYIIFGTGVTLSQFVGSTVILAGIAMYMLYQANQNRKQDAKLVPPAQTEGA